MRDFTGSPVVKTQCFQGREHGLIPVGETMIPHAVGHMETFFFFLIEIHVASEIPALSLHFILKERFHYTL